MKRGRRPRGGFWDSSDAVSDVVGSILLVGITVLLAGALGTMIFTIAKPASTLAAQVTATIDPGNNGWGTGDERIALVHGGGEPVPANASVVRITLGGTVTELSDAAGLGGAFADGKLTIGETWERVQNLGAGLAVSVRLVTETGGGASQVVAAVSTFTDCSGDATPPFVSVWSQTPSDVTATYSGSVMVEGTLTDACQGIDESVSPNLYFRVDPGSNPAYTGPIAMTELSPNVWRANITGVNWSQEGSHMLEYHLDPMTDLGGNSGPSATQQDYIDDSSTFTYVSSNAALVGTVSAFASAQQADGQYANLSEAAQAGPSSTTTATYSGTGATGSGIGGGAYSDALSSNDAWAVLDSSADYVEVSGFTLPPGAMSILSVTTGFEGGKSATGGNDPNVELSYASSGCPANAPLAVTLTSSTDSAFTKNVTSGCSWTVARVDSMTVRVTATSIGNRDARIDHIYVTVKFVASTTVHNMTVELRLPLLPGGATQTLQILYKAPGENFRVKVFDGTAWNDRTPPDLFLTNLPTSWEYELQGDEITGGVGGTGPRIRIVDLDASNQAQHWLLLDYARVRTI